ncbi:MAG: sugar ABC transporter permease [Treponema sp.]|nr:sugar ABC transporter permease [Candidatus Treponema equifaecale]
MKNKIKAGCGQRWEKKWGLIFIAPWLIGFTIFYLGPMVASFIFSFFDYNLIKPEATRVVGLENWKRAIVDDPIVMKSIAHILQYTVISLPISFCFSLLVAILLNYRQLIGQRLFRALFYLPSMVPFVATVLIWQGIMNEQTGWFNLILNSAGLPGVRWLASTKWIYISYTFIGIWGCGNTVLIFLAGLQGVPKELYEAATIDGANGFQRLCAVTVPMMTPVIFYNLLMGIIGLMQFFLTPMVLNNGSGFPNGMTNFPMVYFYRQAFSYFNMGYGAVIAWVIFFIGMIFTLVLFGTSNRWVFYAGEKK